MNNTIIRDAAVRIVDNLSTLNTKTADLETRVTTAEGDIVDLQATIPLAEVTDMPFKSYPGVFKLIEIGGRCEQAVTTGKNLFDLSKASYTSGVSNYAVNGNAVTITPNGTDVIFGTWRQGVTSDLTDDAWNNVIPVKGDTTYTVSYDVSYGSKRIYVAYYSEQGTFIQFINPTDNFTFTTPADARWIVCNVQVGSVTVGTDVTISNIQLEENSVATDYEPYTGGAPSPSPDYPQEVKKTVVNEIKTHGSQCFDAYSNNYAIHNDATLAIEDSGKKITVKGSDYRSKVTYILDNEQYAGKSITITCKISKTVENALLYIGLVVKNTDGTITYCNLTSVGGSVSKTYTIPSDISGIEFDINVNDSTTALSTENVVTIEDLMVSDSGITEFKPYTESAIKLSKPIELYGIGDVQDTIDIENAVINRRFSEVVFDGSEIIAEKETYFTISLNQECVNGKVLCNIDTIARTTTNYARFEKYDMSLDEFKAYVVDKYEYGDPVYVVCRLAEPITEPLPIIDQKALNSLPTHDGVTYVDFDSEVKPTIAGVTALTQEGSYILDALAKNKETAIGDYITTTETTLPGSYSGRLKIDEIGGRCEQVVTTGKNLLENTSNGWTFNGITYVVNSDGSVTANNTATAESTMDVNELILEDGDYILSGRYNETFFCRVWGYKDDEWRAITSTLNNDNARFNVDNSVYSKLLVHVVVTNATTLNNATLYPMIRLASETDPTYEPYTGGAPSPSPDYPQEIKKTVISEIKTHGKNFAQFSNGEDTQNGITAKIENGTITVTGTPTIESGVIIPIHAKSLTANGLEDGMTYYAKDCCYIRVNMKDGTKQYFTKFTFNKETMASVRPYVEVKVSDFVNGKVIYPSLTTDPDAEWEPYTESTITLSQPVELYGIGDAQDTIEDGVVKRKFAKSMLNGSEDWRYTDSPDRLLFYMPRRNTVYQNAIYNFSKITCMSDKLISTRWYDITKMQDGIIVINDDSIAVRRLTLDGDLSAFKTSLSENPMTVVYELAEPTTEPLPIVDQMAFNSLKTYDRITYVEFDSEVKATSKVEYGITKNGGYILEGMLAGRNGELLAERVAALEATLVNNI